MTEATARKRGPSPRISREAVLDVARRLPQERLTMAAIGAELGVTSGALYRYFPDRAAVVDALAQETRELLEPPDEKLPWREWLLAAARRERSLWLTHPELRGAAAGRAVARPALGVTRVGLRVLTHAGFTPDDAFYVLAVVSGLAYSYGHYDDASDAADDDEIATEAVAIIEEAGLTIDAESLFEQLVGLVLDGLETRKATHRGR